MRNTKHLVGPAQSGVSVKERPDGVDGWPILNSLDKVILAAGAEAILKLLHLAASSLLIRIIV